MTATALVEQVELDRPVDLRTTLGPFRSSGGDRSVRIGAGEAWRASLTPDGPATLHLALDASGMSLVARAWGPGAEHAAAGAARLVGAYDDDAAFRPDRDSLVGRLHRRYSSMRVGASGDAYAAALPAVVGQRVTGGEAARAWHGMLGRWGSPAPGPGEALGLRVPPPPSTIRSLDYSDLHHLGVERKRADALRTAARHATRLDAAARAGDAIELRRVLSLLPGIGPWTTALIVHAAAGDPDAALVGDFHVPHHICAALAGEQRGTDERMLELLEPYRGQRARVQRLILMGTPGAERRGPRYRPIPIARY